MAYSSSVKRAQVIKRCEFCEENNIRWRCLDCDQSICDKCRNIHLKARGTSNHQVVTITTPIKDVQRKIITDNIPCKDHKTKMTCLFCKTCDCLVCTDCVTTHTKHHFVPIDSILEEKIEQLKSCQSDISDRIKVCESKSLETGRFTSKYNSVYKDSMEKIKEREKKLIDDIMKYSKELQDQLKVGRLNVDTTVSKTAKEISQTKRKLEEQKDEVDAILTSKQGKLIIESTVMIPELNIDPILNTEKLFVPGGGTTKKIQELFGSLQDISIIIPVEGHDHDDIQVEVIGTYTTDLGYIPKILTLDETTAWISSDNILKKVKITDQKVKTLQEISLDICDMAVTNNEDILVTLDNAANSDIKVLTKSGEIRHFMTVAPLIPRGIHVTRNNDVIVCVRDSGDLYGLTDLSQRAVILYGLDCKEKQRYQFDKDGKRLFTNPRRITTNNNQDIVVIDQTSLTTGRVVCLDSDGRLQWVYKGHSEINAIKQFDPLSIVTTSTGLIIISDGKTHALHILSGEGKVLTCKVVKDLGIEYPWGLDFDKSGQIWVGCALDGKLHSLKSNKRF